MRTYTIIHDGVIMNGSSAEAEEAENDGAIIISFDKKNEMYQLTSGEKTHLGKIVGVDFIDNEIFPFLEKNKEQHLKEARENGLLILKVIEGRVVDIN